MALRKPVIGIPEGGPHTALGELPTGDQIDGADVDLSTALHNTLGGKEGTGPEFIHLNAAELADIAAALVTLASHISDGTIHFTEGSISHLNIQDIGVNSHATIDAALVTLASHISDATIHFTEGSIDHLNIQNIGTNSHAAIDAHIASSANPHSVTFTQAVAADGGTDITAAEAETLTDGSNADALHSHAGGGGTENDLVAARKSDALNVPNAWADVTFNNTDQETDAAIVEHDNTNTDRIICKTVGALYRIDYKVDTLLAEQLNDNARLQGRVRSNDTAVLNGSFSTTGILNDSSIDNFETHDQQLIGHCFFSPAAATDFITLQLQLVQLGGSSLVVPLDNANLTVTRMK